MKIANFTAIIDSREQTPVLLKLNEKGDILNSQVGTLYTGDYSIKGFEDLIAIERKSLSDLMGCIGSGRERFEKEIQRLRGYEVKSIVVEGSWHDIETGNYRSKVKPTAAIGTLMGWIAMGIPITMAESHDRAGLFIARMLFISARRYQQRLKNLGTS